MVILLLTSIVIASNHTKCVSLSDQNCVLQPTLINLHPKEYDQELHYYSFAVKLDKCDESCNILNGLSYRLSAPIKTEDLNIYIYVFNIITGESKSKNLTKDILCECK